MPWFTAGQPASQPTHHLTAFISPLTCFTQSHQSLAWQKYPRLLVAFSRTPNIIGFPKVPVEIVPYETLPLSVATSARRRANLLAPLDYSNSEVHLTQANAVDRRPRRSREARQRLIVAFTRLFVHPSPHPERRPFTDGSAIRLFPQRDRYLSAAFCSPAFDRNHSGTMPRRSKDPGYP